MKALDYRNRLQGQRLSLRRKGFIVFMLLVVYSALLTGFVLHEKGVLLTEFTELQGMAGTAVALRQLETDVLRAVGGVFVNPDGPSYAASRIARARADLHAIKNQYTGVTASFPEIGQSLAALDATLERLGRQSSEFSLSDLRARLMVEDAKLGSLADMLLERHNELAEKYRQRSDSVAGVALLLGTFGVVMFGTVIGVFFTRLTSDLQLLMDHAKKIVKGDRSNPIPVSRNDEVGELMDAFNHMSMELDEREKSLEIERHKYFHREKMASIGELAAGIAHEIGNPISAIAGVAQAMREIQAAEACPNRDTVCRPELILAQTTRLGAIAREIADFATPVPAEHQLLDLHDLIRTTCRFLRYDRRFRRINLDINLGNNIPAISAIGDRLVQVLMNLLINAVDALEGVEDRVPTISITTSLLGNEVCIAVADNGCGMDENTRQHAFEPFFTTKRPGKGTGLGLALCYSIVEEHGGRVGLESTPKVGTCVRVMLPVNTPRSHQEVIHHGVAGADSRR